ncbi:MAG TPA: PIN domain-containing protein [Thermoanaerobaculia bacterium]|nr:PIN domain-containing protein [Thermoanaerobaculia bacterium]
MIFVDTGALLGRHLRDDQHHSDAVPIWSDLFRARARFVTSNFILDEAFTLMARRGGYRFAAERARRLYASREFTILRPSEEHEIAALDFFEKYADQEVSFTDCVSFALMRAHGLRRAFAFDRHFRDAGFETIPPF